jgi:hypothetical protein
MEGTFIMSQFQKYLRILTLLLGCTFIVAVAAQEPQRGETVTERSRPDMDARGIRIGAFETFPAISIDLLHDDNIYANNDFQVDDLITVVRPEITLVRDWNRAALEVGAELEAGRYDDFDTEDYEDWRIWGDLGMQLGRGRLSGELSYQELHQTRTSADDQRSIKPTEYSIGSWFMAYRNTYGRLSLRADARQSGFDFDDTITLDGPESNADRDRKQSDLRARMGYSWTPSIQPFLRIGLTDIDFDQTFDNDGFERSSTGYDIVGGTDIDLPGQTFGEVFVGYVNRDYDDLRYSTINGPIFGAELTWNISGLTTLQFAASRLIKSTTIIGASGIIDTEVGIEIDHELLRNLILSFDISLSNEDFDGIDRSDDIFRTQLEVAYLMNRYLQLRLGFNIFNRDTAPADSGGREFDKQQIYLGIQGQI